MLHKFFFPLVILSIIALTCAEPNLPGPKKICPTCVKYKGTIELADLENNFNWVMFYEVNPDFTVVYRSVRSTPGIRAFYYIQDPLKPVPEPLADVDFCSIHDLSQGLESFYQLTTILASYILPVGLPCSEALGKRPIIDKVSRTTYYLNREPTPCNKFNVTVEFATLETKLNPYMILTFTVTKPGITCNLPPPTLPPTVTIETPKDPSVPKTPNNPNPAPSATG